MLKQYQLNCRVKYSEKGKKAQNKHKIKSFVTSKHTWHKNDSIRVDFPLNSENNNNILLVIYKLFSRSPNIPRGFITSAELLA